MKLAALRAFLEASVARQDPRDVRVIEELRAVLAVLGPAPEDAPGPQGVLPGLAAPTKVRRRSQHRFGLLRKVHVLATTLDEAHTEERETCIHCGTERRRANTGKRLGAKVTYSKDSGVWSAVSPPCIPKSK